MVQNVPHGALLVIKSTVAFYMLLHHLVPDFTHMANGSKHLGCCCEMLCNLCSVILDLHRKAAALPEVCIKK